MRLSEAHSKVGGGAGTLETPSKHRLGQARENQGVSPGSRLPRESESLAKEEAEATVHPGC